jgi:hypothetical protein
VHRQKASVLFMPLGWSSVSVTSLMMRPHVSRFGEDVAGVMDLDVVPQSTPSRPTCLVLLQPSVNRKVFLSVVDMTALTRDTT